MGKSCLKVLALGLGRIGLNDFELNVSVTAKAA
jgi:hypothetical protein